MADVDTLDPPSTISPNRSGEKLTHWCILLDAAISHIITFGPGTLLAKIDIKHAFRLLPVYISSRLSCPGYAVEQ